MRREVETKVATRSPSTLQKHVKECGLYSMGIGEALQFPSEGERMISVREVGKSKEVGRQKLPGEVGACRCRATV